MWLAVVLYFPRLQWGLGFFSESLQPWRVKCLPLSPASPVFTASLFRGCSAPLSPAGRFPGSSASCHGICWSRGAAAGTPIIPFPLGTWLKLPRVQDGAALCGKSHPMGANGVVPYLWPVCQGIDHLTGQWPYHIDIKYRKGKSILWNGKRSESCKLLQQRNKAEFAYLLPTSQGRSVRDGNSYLIYLANIYGGPIVCEWWY